MQSPGRDAPLGRPVGAARQPYLNVRWLGRMDFRDALALQEKIVAQKRENREAADEVLLLEHDPVRLQEVLDLARVLPPARDEVRVHAPTVIDEPLLKSASDPPALPTTLNSDCFQMVAR